MTIDGTLTFNTRLMTWHFFSRPYLKLNNLKKKNHAAVILLIVAFEVVAEHVFFCVIFSQVVAVSRSPSSACWCTGNPGS